MNNTALNHHRCVPSPSHLRLKSASAVLLAAVAGCFLAGSSTAQSDEKSSAVVSETNTSPVPLPEARQLVLDLGSDRFATRQKAISSLRDYPAEQLEQVGKLIHSEGSSEAQRRWIEVLEVRYGSLDLKSEALSYVSESLERDAKAETWFISEAATKVLDKHWKQRVKLAVIELSRLNFPLDPKDPEKLFEPDEERFGRPTSSNHLKLIVDHTFPTSPEVADLLRRLAPLRSTMFLRSPQLVSLVIVDGHSMPEERLSELRSIFGDIAIQERGPVCLGISPNIQLEDGNGVLVGSVAEGKSADLAGIKEGDRILDLDGVPVVNFDDMVKRLRKYKIGDKVNLTVYSRKPREVEVTLTGWYEGATNAPVK